MTSTTEVQLLNAPNDTNHPSWNTDPAQCLEQCWCHEAGTYSTPKALNSVEKRIAAARSDESWSQLLKPKPHKSLEFAAWGNGRGRGWANGAGGGGGFANARYGGGWAMVAAGATEAVPGATVAVDEAL